MANIIDYLEWRGDVPFDIDPFNEVDALILSELVYVPFDGLVPGPGLKEKIQIEDLCKKFFEKHSKEELMARTAFTKLAPFLMHGLINSKRFGSTKLCGFVNQIDKDNISQFSACTFYLNDGTIFVAFRGTDDTLVGWREDYNMCYSDGTGGQLKAVEYLNKNFARTMKPIRVGGHSKGGNFAVFSSAFCKMHIKDSIIDVYNFDGPGCIQEILKRAEYKSIIGRVHKFIPEESIIGLLLYSKADTKVIGSFAKGITQHDPFSWNIIRNKFEYKEDVTASAKKIDEIIKKWSDEVDYESRALFGEIFFSSLASMGATKLSQITSNRAKSLVNIRKEIQNLDPEHQAVIMDVFSKLILAGGESIKNSLGSVLSKTLTMRKKEKK